MNAYIPSFEIELPAGLFQSADDQAAMRAALQLPNMARAQGLRMVLFMATSMLTRDPDLPASGRLNRAPKRVGPHHAAS
ncbi:hypothetical protein [Jannaschia aquimarina]|uniref:Uncharacterized protein n=1 Tax=Jannaschia aquimarina TaxID=935700 RepID=A0A0D1CNQ9_9RHOB|nr:hypothetical protein [Jannaschia aquimarina]KIT16337.1 hypothetical protein jaqu_19330 [Jannaschia aquimarina]SNT25978.1 hypothetical protein SAMN05421775_10952 [Jannaschia aquimarina]